MNRCAIRKPETGTVTKKSVITTESVMFLRCLYTNIDGLNSGKGAELQIILEREKPDIVFITETKLSEASITSQYLNCDNYSVFRRDRTTRKGGGVMLMVNKGIPAWDGTWPYWRDIEAVSCEIKVGPKKAVLACVYRPPNTGDEANSRIRDLIVEVSGRTNGQILICGDFNFGGIRWATEAVEGESESEQFKFHETCQDEFLYQHVREFTRARGSDEPSLLDLVLSRDQLEVEELKYCPPIGKSDHCVLTFTFLVDRGVRMANSCSTKRNYHKGDYNAARQMLGTVNWEEDLRGKETEEAWLIFLEHVLRAVQLTVPLSQSKRR